MRSILLKLYLVDQGNLKEIKKPVFSTGDTYIVDDDKTIYVWIGNKCSIDEKTAGAAQARTLDQQRGGAAKIITIDQNQESSDFMKSISSIGAMKVVEKNYAKTLLKDVSTGDFAGFSEWKNVLYRVSAEEFDGINTMKMIQVPFTKDSLESEDCFIADLGNKVYIWQGSTCNVKEKVKAMQFAREFDADRAGGQRPKIFMENDGDQEFMGIFEGILPTQDRKTVDLKVERFEEGQTQPTLEVVHIPEPVHVPEPVPEPTPAPTPEPVHVPAPTPELEPTPAPEPTPSPVSSMEILVQKGSGRLTCPRCGNLNKSMIREVEDRTNILMDYPLIYGKKYVCGECGAEWKKEDV